jgi:putative transcription antitermination factor YqgF
MEGIMDLAKEFGLYVIEDNAQAIGAKYTFSDGTVKSTGTIGHIGTTSFFPSKNLGCYGDGGAMFTNDDEIAKNLKMIANHGQEVKYYHKVTGCNSRLDSIQAAILNIKLNHLDSYSFSRNKMAENYDQNFSEIPELSIPKSQYNSTHVFHQYTLKIAPELRNYLIDFLKDYFKNEEVELVVVGLPKNMKNVESLIEPLILKYIKIINDNFPLLSIERFDERFTSKLAFQAMIDGGLKKKKRKNKETIDMVSATIILQDYLRSRKI